MSLNPKDKFFPITLDDAPDYFPKTPEKQRTAMLVYNKYISFYERTYSKEASVKEAAKKFSLNEQTVEKYIYFAEAVIDEMKKQNLI